MMKKIFLIVFSFISLALSNAYAGGVEFGEVFSFSHSDKKVSNLSSVMDDDGRIYFGWAREDKDRVNIYTASSSDGGKTFSKPVRVNDDKDSPAWLHNAPTMALGSKGELYVAWSAGRTDGEFSADLKFARSLDSGKTFEKALTVNTDRSPASRGFESMAVDKNGLIYIAWLDGREKKNGTSSTFIAISKDGKSFEQDIRIDSGSCPCCRTAITIAPDGNIYVAWRKVFKGDLREIVVSSSKDGTLYTEPSVVGNDNWAIAGCPHRGPSLYASKEALHIVWYTEGVDFSPAIYSGISEDGGKHFTKKELPWAKASFPDHPVMGLKDGNPIFAWEETTPVISRVAFAASIDEKGRQMNQGVRKSHDPVIATNKKGDILIGWVQDEIRNTKFSFRLAKGGK